MTLCRRIDNGFSTTLSYLLWAVGWVERSETHHAPLVGLATLDPPYNSCQVRVQLAHGPRQAYIMGEGFFDFAAGVQNGAVIAAAEISADLLQR